MGGAWMGECMEGIWAASVIYFVANLHCFVKTSSLKNILSRILFIKKNTHNYFLKKLPKITTTDYNLKVV